MYRRGLRIAFCWSIISIEVGVELDAPGKSRCHPSAGPSIPA